VSLRVGLTGGIGSGKTTVADELAQAGAGVVDTDRLSHELTEAGGAAIPALERAFGAQILTTDRALDRTRMRELAFSQPQVRKRLQSLLHPMILELARRQCEELQAQVPYIVFVVPLLVETAHWLRRVHRVLVIDCSTDTQIRRVRSRSQLTEPQVRAILAAQASRQQRLEVAHDVLVNDADNSRPISCLTWRLHQHYLRLAAIMPPTRV
jgi:dephospho-CoA kinase